MSQKRDRSINFTREEVDILIDLIEENIHVLENKKSDGATWREKEKCWKAIETSFNLASGVTYRNSKNLRLKYEGIKRNIRKKSALIRAETHSTVEAPSTAFVLTASETKIKQILLSVDGMESNFDSDHVPNAKVENQVENDLEEISETDKKWSQWKPASLRPNKHPALYKLKLKRPFEKVAESKLEITELQKKILEEELAHSRKKWTFEEKEREQQQKRWEFEEEERQHKREIWALEKKLLLKKFNAE